MDFELRACYARVCTDFVLYVCSHPMTDKFQIFSESYPCIYMYMYSLLFSSQLTVDSPGFHRVMFIPMKTTGTFLLSPPPPENLI